MPLSVRRASPEDLDCVIAQFGAESTSVGVLDQRAARARCRLVWVERHHLPAAGTLRPQVAAHLPTRTAPCRARTSSEKVVVMIHGVELTLMPRSARVDALPRCRQVQGQGLRATNVNTWR